MNDQFWTDAPKQFCEDASFVVVNRGDKGECFYFGLRSGANAQAFALTPQHAKRMAQMISYHIDQYEQKFGTINVEDWTPELKSPFQLPDIKPGGESKK